VRLLTLRQKCALIKHSEILGPNSDSLPKVESNGVMITDVVYIELMFKALEKKNPGITMECVEGFLQKAYATMVIRNSLISARAALKQT
jgi:hypothetical protein